LIENTHIPDSHKHGKVNDILYTSYKYNLLTNMRTGNTYLKKLIIVLPCSHDLTSDTFKFKNIFTSAKNTAICVDKKCGLKMNVKNIYY
jgi:hypothetical protein